MSFYAVKRGKNVGVYNTWTECKQQVDGFSGPVFKKFDSYEEALQFITNTPSTSIPTFDLNRVLYVDGGCNNFTKPYAYGSVVTHLGEDVIPRFAGLLSDMELVPIQLPIGLRTLIKIDFKDVTSQQNNGAELLAAVAGLRIAIYLSTNGYQINYVFSDSKLITDFWSKRIKEETASKMDPVKLKYVKELIELRVQYERLGGSLYKISGDSNPADLGFHN